MRKTTNFDENDRELAKLARLLSHPARIAILRFLASTDCCISGDISNEIPLSRTTVSQHLNELKGAGLITGEIEGVRVNYCLDSQQIEKASASFDGLFEILKNNKPKQCNP
ncbi:MAG: metalloregulator ArsR/SmtB family transcription factor [Bacteroidetes bacterium]|nr:metalloregulator ArsR/SmtB family transcription factor [Bacteroidota bacterium]